MKFNAEQLTEYLNMEAAYKDMTQTFEQIKPDMVNEQEFEDLSRRYAYASIQIIKLRSFVRGPSYGQAKG